MNKNDKDWLFSKITTFREISEGINNTLEYTDIFLSKSMVLWINNFIKEIHEKIIYKKMKKINDPIPSKCKKISTCDRITKGIVFDCKHCNKFERDD